MIDQNTTTIITSIITVIGTLGGAITGVLLSNSHSTKLERLKIEEERNKRTHPIIEEAYTTVNQILKFYENLSNDLFGFDLTIGDYTSDLGYDFYAKNLEVRPTLERLHTLIHLYLPSLIDQAEGFNKSADILKLKLGVYYLRIKSNKDLEDAREGLSKAESEFKKTSQSLLAALEKMVR